MYENGTSKKLYSPSPEDALPEARKVLRTLVSHLDKADDKGRQWGTPPFSKRRFTARFFPFANDAVYTIDCQPHKNNDRAYSTTSASRQPALLTDRNQLLLSGSPTFVALGEASLELFELIEQMRHPQSATASYENLPFPKYSVSRRMFPMIQKISAFFDLLPPGPPNLMR